MLSFIKTHIAINYVYKLKHEVGKGNQTTTLLQKKIYAHVIFVNKFRCFCKLKRIGQEHLYLLKLK